MARFRTDLEQNKSINSIQAQPASDAMKVGSAKAGVAYFVVFTAPGATGATFSIESATDAGLPDGAWKQIGTPASITTTAPNVYTISLSDLGEVLRWRVSGSLSTTVVFSCTVFLTDQ